MIGVLAGFGSAGTWQGVYVFNNADPTANPCNTASVYPLSCDALSITNWTVEVDYTALDGGVQTPQPAVYNSSLACTSSGCDTIDTTSDVFDNPLYSLPYSDANDCCDTLVTRIVFTGQLSSQISIWNPGASGPTAFFPQSPFSVTVDLTNPNDASAVSYQNGTTPGYLTDLLISDNSGDNSGGGGEGGESSVPEPATLTLVAAGVLALGARRFHRR